MKFSFKDILSKCDQISSFLRICSYLLKKPLMENFLLCPVWIKKLEPFLGHFETSLMELFGENRQKK